MHTGRGRRVLKTAAALAAVMACGCASAATIEAEIDDAALPPEARAIDQVRTAAELAGWGRARRDAGALIMAARLLAETPLRQSGDEPAFLTASALLDEAQALVGDNPNALDAIQRLRDGGVRGVETSPFGRGPLFLVRQIGARDTYAFDVEARGGEVLRVAAIGDGDTDVDLAVRDAGGALLCRDGFGDHYPVCTVAPRSSGKMRIDIINRGDVWTRVQILSN